MIPDQFNRLIEHIAHGTHVRAQVIRHLIVGGGGVLFNWVTFTLLRQYTGFNTLESTLIVHILLLIMMFPMQKFFTFKSRSKTRRQIARFLINDAGYMAVDYLLAALFIDWLGLVPAVGKGLGLAILTPLSFASQRYWVFRNEAA